MSEKNYFTPTKNYKRVFLQTSGLFLMFIGFFLMIYIFFPLISWQIYFSEKFSRQEIAIPIPKWEVVTDNSLKNLFADTKEKLSGTDFTNARNWFPEYYLKNYKKSTVEYFNISIPKININNAIVSTKDTNLTKHLVNYPGSAVPPQPGTSVVFGHSTLPLGYNPKDYKTIFSNLYKLDKKDKIIININKEKYIYFVESIKVIDPQDSTVLEQDYNNSYLVLVTCTPPGTVWKRLIIKARIDDI